MQKMNKKRIPGDSLFLLLSGGRWRGFGLHGLLFRAEFPAEFLPFGSSEAQEEKGDTADPVDHHGHPDTEQPHMEEFSKDKAETDAEGSAFEATETIMVNFTSLEARRALGRTKEQA